MKTKMEVRTRFPMRRRTRPRYDDIEDDVASAPSQNVVYVEPEVRDFVPSTLVYPDAPPVDDADEQPLPQDMLPKFDKVSFE